MGMISRLFRRDIAVTTPSGPLISGILDGIGFGFTSLFGGGGREDAGVAITPDVAITASAVYGCVSIIANAIASLPVHVRLAATGEAQPNHPLRFLLHSEPNEFMTAAVFREALMANLLLWGNGYAVIERKGGRVVGLWPLQSRDTYPFRNNGQLYYRTIVLGNQFIFRPDQVLHVLNWSLNGIMGISPIEQARQSIGLSLAAERFAALLFANNGNLGGVIEVPPGMKDDAIDRFKKSWAEKFTGIANSHKVAILPGMKYHNVGIDPEKAQMLETRTHQVREVARIYRVPLHKLGDLERATFTNIEQQSMEFVSDTLMPWAIKLEQEQDRKLLLESEKGRLETKYDLNAVARADTQTRYTAHNLGVQGGWLLKNEVRRMEGLPPIEGGDVPMTPLNMGPASATGGGDPKTKAKATRSLLREAAGRILTKESLALRRAAKKCGDDPAAFCAWAEKFYRQHEVVVTRSIAAPLQAAAAIAGVERRSGILAAGFARLHCDRQLAAVLEAREAGKLDVLIDDLIQTGARRTAARLAKLITQEKTHV